MIRKKGIKRIVLILVILIPLIGATVVYSAIFSANTSINTQDQNFYVRTGSSFSDLMETLKEEKIIDDFSSFELTCRLKKFGDDVKPGRYVIRKNMSNNELVNMFRSGNQTPLLVPVENVSTIEEMAGLLSKYLEADSLSFANIFLDPNVALSYGFNAEEFPSMFIANRYELFWTTTPEKFLEKMKGLHDNFWTIERKTLADKIGLTSEEIYTLASIVKSETGNYDEAPIIAGLYLNRLKIGMRLQSDPTALFAGRKRDVQRVLTSDLLVNSPYNTYQNAGLPPGPICIVESGYLDAVLRHNQNDYLYMCAKADFSGKHNFSKTLAQHEIYRSQYRKALDERNIRR